MPPSPIHSSIRRIFEEAFNQGKLTVVDEVLSIDRFVHNNAFSGAQQGQNNLKELIAMYRTGFPDLHCTIEEEIRENDKIAGRWTMSGTQKGLFQGNPPTGKSIQIQGIFFARFEKEKIREYWILIDRFDLLQQLGIIPR